MGKSLPRILLTAFVVALSASVLDAADAQRTPAGRPAAPARPTPPGAGELREPIAAQLPDARFRVGDRVTLRLTLSDRSDFTLANQRGKIVLLDFWMSTDLGKAHLKEVLAAQSKYADKGLVVVGISGDRQLSDAESTMRELGITWPMHWNGYWRENKLLQTFGVPALPRVGIVGPDGTLLYFGRGAEPAGELDKAFLNHPPFAKDQVALVVDSLKEANRAMDDGDLLAGYLAYAALPGELRNDTVVSKKANDLRFRLVHASDKAFKAVDELVAKEAFVDAAVALKAIAKSLKGMSQDAEANRRLDEILARPEAKEQVTKAEREPNAHAALDAARKLRDAGSDIAAYERFRAISMDYAETVAAGEALIAVKAYDTDPIFQRKRKDALAGPTADRMLKLAESIRRNGRSDLARQRLEEVIDRYPDTTFADMARKALDKLSPTTQPQGN